MAQSRTEIIAAAVMKQLMLRRSILDQCDDIGEVTVVVRLMAGTSTIRSTVVSEHHINRRTPMTVERT